MKISSAIFLIFFSWFTVNAQELVLPGDYPDPSIVKIGNTYWASATTSNWAPAFPIMKSTDLRNWKTITHAFLKLPDWADYYFWAPEISYDNGRVYLYYAAHKKGGNLCLGVASADKPEGPYKDHGPLMCEEAGSIDAFPIRDENGKLHLVWKEDGNSVNKPTPIWIMEMNEDRTKLTGEKKELFRNDAGWEGNLVEGVSMVRKGEYYYALYAAAACCGAACTYGVGIARSKGLKGKWEKYTKNPVLTNSNEWVCPGHGTPVEFNGKNYFLYHAYNKYDNVFTGRQGLLIEYRFTADNWIEFVTQPVSPPKADKKTNSYSFSRKSLSDQWQWSVFRDPSYQIKSGELHLSVSDEQSGNFLGHKTTSANYTAVVTLHLKKSNAAGGIAIIGDEKNIVSAVYDKGEIKILQLKDGKLSEIIRKPVAVNKKLKLQVVVTNGKDILFSYSSKGIPFQSVNEKAVDGAYLPPWDRAVRVGLIVKGNAGTKAVFDSFEMISQ